MQRPMVQGLGLMGLGALLLAAACSPSPVGTSTARPLSRGAQDVRYAYVSNAAEGSVSVVDVKRGQVTGKVKIGDKAAHGIAASPDGRLGYAALEGVNEVAIIDGEALKEVQRIPIPFSSGMAQHGVDISPDGKYLWIGARMGGDNRGEVVRAEIAVVNTGTGQVEDILQTGLGVPAHYAMTPDGKELWVASTTVDLVWVVDTQQRAVAAAIPLVPPRADRSEERLQQLASSRIIALNEVAIAPDGKRAYAVGPVGDLVFVLDVPTRKLLGTIKAGINAHGVAVSKDSKEVWTSNWSGTLSIIDAQSLKVKETVTLPGRPNHIAFSPDGLMVYITRTGEDPEKGELLVLDKATRKTVATLVVGTGPHEISLEDIG